MNRPWFGPWVVTDVKPDGERFDPQTFTWKLLVAHLAHNLGHVALALYELADRERS